MSLRVCPRDPLALRVRANVHPHQGDAHAALKDQTTMIETAQMHGSDPMSIMPAPLASVVWWRTMLISPWGLPCRPCRL